MPEGGVADDVVPVLDGELGGEAGSSAGVAIVGDLQRRVVQIVRQLPRHSRPARPPDVAADRAVGDLENGSDLPVASTEAVLQPENISNLGALDTLFWATVRLLAQGSLARLQERLPTSGHPAPLPAPPEFPTP